MRRWLILALLLIALPCAAQVVYETSAQGYTAGPATSTTYNITLGGASTTRAVAVWVFSSAGSTPPTAVKLGGSGGTSFGSPVGSDTSVAGLYLYCLATNLTGSQAVYISYGATNETSYTSDAISATGVNQTTPCINFNNAHGYGSPLSIAITSLNGDLTMSSVLSVLSTASTNQTLKQSNTTGGTYDMYTDIGPGTGTTTHSWTISSPGNGAVVIGADFESATVACPNPTFGTASGLFTTNPSTTITSSGCTICYTSCATNGCTPSNPAASTPGTCSAGATLSSGGTVNLVGQYETLAALATESGDTNSAVENSGQYQTAQIISKVDGIATGIASGNISTIDGVALGFRSGTYNAQDVLAALTVTPSVPIMIDWGGLTNGSAPTGAAAANSTHGTACASWAVSNTHSSLFGSTSAHLSNLITQLLIGGTLYTGAGTPTAGLGLKYATGTGGDNASCTLASTYPTLAIGHWLEWTIPNTDTGTNDYSLTALVDSSTGYYGDAALEPQGAGATFSCLGYEVAGNNVSGPTCGTGSSKGEQVQPNTLYWLTLLYSDVGCPGACAQQKMAVYGINANGTLSQIGSNITVTPASGFSNPVEFVEFGVTGAETESAGFSIYTGPAKFCLTFPCLP